MQGAGSRKRTAPARLHDDDFVVDDDDDDDDLPTQPKARKPPPPKPPKAAVIMPPPKVKLTVTQPLSEMTAEERLFVEKLNSLRSMEQQRRSTSQESRTEVSLPHDAKAALAALEALKQEEKQEMPRLSKGPSKRARAEIS